MKGTGTAHGAAAGWPWPPPGPAGTTMSLPGRDGPGVVCRAVDLAFADFVLRMSGGGARDRSSPLWMAALLASAVVGAGEVRLEIDGLAGRPMRLGDTETVLPGADEWRAALLGAAAVGDGRGDGLLVLDRGGLYLRRFWEAEREVASFAAARAAAAPAIDGRARRRLAGICPRLFPGGRDGVDWQMVAALAAAARPFAVISGGPGTGKTHTAARIISMLAAVGGGLRVALAAPTGKAASRLKESVEAQAGLPGIGAIPAFTLHRLLGMGGAGGPRHGPDRPLPYDLVVVDEASMVDLSLMHLLVRALAPGCRLVLLGDHRQLAAVEPGSVFAAFCARDAAACFSGWFRDLVAEVSGCGLPGDAAEGCDGVVLLRDSRRFRRDGGIGMLAAAAAAGDADAVLDMLAAGDDPEVVFHRPGDDPAGDLAAFLARRRGFLSSSDLDGAFTWLDRFRILCPFRSGPGGVDEVNRLARSMAEGPGGGMPGGMPVMVRRNDYGLGLYNGDVGVVCPETGGEAVFRRPDGGLRRFAVPLLPEWEPVYAMTVHKAQGSEFDEVLLLLPRPVPRSGRELFYTAVTRARKRVHVWGDPEAIRETLAAAGPGESPLAARIAAFASDPG